MGAGPRERSALMQRYEKLGYWQRKALGGLLKDTVAKHADAVALVDGVTRLTYAQLDQKADRLASGLSRLGINKGDRVLLQLPNGEAFVLSLFALLRIGHCPSWRCLRIGRRTSWRYANWLNLAPTSLHEVFWGLTTLSLRSVFGRATLACATFWLMAIQGRGRI